MGEYQQLAQTSVKEIGETDGGGTFGAGVTATDSGDVSSVFPSIQHHSTVDLDDDLHKMDREEEEIRFRLDELHTFWNMRREKVQLELEAVRQRRGQMQFARSATYAQSQPASDPPPGPESLSWVDSTGFQCLGSMVIVANLGFMAYMLHLQEDPSASHPAWINAHSTWWLDQGFLLCYIAELTLKGIYYQRQLLLGEIAVVWWNWLDSLIVISGIIDQWVLPSVVNNGGGPSKAGHHSMISTFLRSLRLLRLFRVMRILKAVKIFFQFDITWVEEEKFHYFIMVIIALNTLTIGLELDYPWSGWMYLEHIMLVIYAFELLARLRLHRCEFFYGDDMLWNNMDFVIVVGAIADQWLLPVIRSIQDLCGLKGSWSYKVLAASQITTMLRMVRLLRLLRLVRLLHFIKPLYKLLLGVLNALQGIKWVIVLTIVFLYAFAILMTTLVGHGLAYDGETPEEVKGLFNSLPESMFLLFKVMNDDQSVMTPLLPTIIFKLLFVIFMIMSNWSMLAILVAVVSDNMLSSTQKQNEEERVRQAAELKEERIRRLTDIIDEMDVNHDGSVTLAEFEKMLSSEAMSSEMCDASGLKKKDLRDLFAYLSFDHAEHQQAAINYSTFIDGVLKESNPVNERSIYRLEKKVQSVEYRLNQRIDGLLSQLRELEASF